MALKFSTGLRAAWLGTGSLVSLLNSCKIVIYSGSPPLSADDAASGTVLAELKNGTQGFTFTRTGTELNVTTGETVSGSGLANGTPGYFRLILNSEANLHGQSTTAYRIQGTVGQFGADLILNYGSIALNAPLTLDTFKLTLSETVSN